VARWSVDDGLQVILGVGVMPTCAECLYMEDPSPTVIRCRLREIYCYLDTRACESFRPFKGDDKGQKKET